MKIQISGKLRARDGLSLLQLVGNLHFYLSKVIFPELTNTSRCFPGPEIRFWRRILYQSRCFVEIIEPRSTPHQSEARNHHRVANPDRKMISICALCPEDNMLQLRSLDSLIHDPRALVAMVCSYDLHFSNVRLFPHGHCLRYFFASILSTR